MSVRSVVLASASKSRASLLTAAGLAFDVVPAHADEDAVKAALKAEGADARQCAETLAEIKAVQVSQRLPEALVIGADQMLECDGVWFDKPADMNGARAHLTAMRGKTHTLPTAVAVVLGGSVIWHHSASPRLTMRDFSDAFIAHYLANTGERILSSVGAYQLEGWGVQLFERIDGDYATILGLPLLPLLAFLREHQVIMK
ncbi:MAG: Maf family protein [Rhodospirillaceae bacterium]|nr:Maf family protein [Rhodospirillaceae bacterium]